MGTPTTTQQTDGLDTPSRSGRTLTRTDIAWVSGAVALVVLAVAVPVMAGEGLRGRIFARAAPLFAQWDPHTGPGTIAAIAVAVAAIIWLPRWAHRLRWSVLLAILWLTSVAWTMSLALVDGWQRGFAGRLVRPDEYLSEVPGVQSVPGMLDTFAGRILDHQPDSWTTHVSGHPPGALLTFVWLDRIGLGGGAWAGAWCVLVGCSGLVAVLVTLRHLDAEAAARRCAPFLALFPGLVWVGVSADGYFMGVAAWGVACVAIATSASRQQRLRSAVFAILGGLLLGWAIFCNYGLVLIGVVAMAVLLAARTARPLIWAIPSALAVVGVFRAFGFWWFEGYLLVVERYYQGIASLRPATYWMWANLAATVFAVGPAGAAGIGRVVAARRWRDPVVLLAIAGLLAILAADVSALSKAETERIWLPFGVWVMVSTALLPARGARVWLCAQAILALAVNHLVLTYW
ncbi:hypothetical protein AAFP35_22030 [Gordonia sp. CPCC 206044]|uniref:hypothetical protein n=1 Tax=Gordonia sp. CPCC 206044 TaxID=3140793 RepID=UPI003AF3EA4B